MVFEFSIPLWFVLVLVGVVIIVAGLVWASAESGHGYGFNLGAILVCLLGCGWLFAVGAFYLGAWLL